MRSDKIAGVMGYLIELDPLYGLIRWPEPDAPEIEVETFAPAKVQQEVSPVAVQPEFNL